MTSSARGARFRYESWSVDASAGRVICRYNVDGEAFTEEIVVPGGGDWSAPATLAAARLLYLLAGVSYYKTAAPSAVDLGDEPLTHAEAALLRAFYTEGLGEYAYENDLDPRDITFVHETRDDAPIAAPALRRGPLIPFGGGLDSIVTVAMLGDVPDAALFVVNRPDDRFPAIEEPASVTGLPIDRAERSIDPKLLDPVRAATYRNGHVPVTGIISAIALLTAVLHERAAVVMSNEWSASSGTIEYLGRSINHQYSKSLEFERLLRTVVTTTVHPELEYFSALRPYSELWIARRFAELTEYHSSFHSCNRAFATNPAARLDHWCGECPKCCFIDLVLAPFVAPDALAAIFGGREPLAAPELRPVFDGLLATSDAFKPFECVGDVEESRAAVLLAADRGDRAAYPLLQDLADAVRATGPLPEIEPLFRPASPHFVPHAYASDDLLV